VLVDPSGEVVRHGRRGSESVGVSVAISDEGEDEKSHAFIALNYPSWRNRPAPVLGHPVTFTATVTPGGAGTPAGAVTFIIDGVPQVPRPLVSSGGRGRATLTTGALSPGRHTVTASYGGGVGFVASVSPALTEVVNPPPAVVVLQRFGIHDQPTRLVLTFNRPMNAATVQDLRNYLLYPIGPHGYGGPHPQPIPITSAVYDPVHYTVTLTPLFRLKFGGYYLLTVSGASPHGLVDVTGVPLVGTNAGGKLGSDYIAVVHGYGPWVTPSSLVQARTATAVPAGPRSLAQPPPRR